jgi:energy-converting hydrogenase Eha subunit C
MHKVSTRVMAGDVMWLVIYILFGSPVNKICSISSILTTRIATMASMQVLRIGPAALLLRVVCVVFVTAASVGVIVTAYVPPLADRRSVRKRLFSSNPKWATVDKKIGAADTDLWTTQLGTLRVPLVGTGTLSWSSKSCTYYTARHLYRTLVSHSYACSLKTPSQSLGERRSAVFDR